MKVFSKKKHNYDEKFDACIIPVSMTARILPKSGTHRSRQFMPDFETIDARFEPHYQFKFTIFMASHKI